MYKGPFLKITLGYSEEAIREIIDFAVSRSLADMSEVYVNIKNCRRAYRGYAYEAVPKMSSGAPSGAKRLVTLALNDNIRFPIDNMIVTRKWKRVPYSRYKRAKDKSKFRSCGKCTNGKQEHWMEKAVETRHPYGGKSSPLIVKNNWKELLLALAAHEFHHIYQFQNNLPRSEIECERAALRTLEEYRAGGA